MTCRRKSPPHYLSVWPVPPSPVTSALLRAVFAVCRRLSPSAWHPAPCCHRGTGSWVVLGARWPPCEHPLPGLGAGDQPHTAEPQRAVPGSRTPWRPSTSQERTSSPHSTRRKGQQARRGRDGGLPQIPTQSQTKNDICPVVTLPAFLRDWGGGVPNKMYV